LRYGDGNLALRVAAEKGFGSVARLLLDRNSEHRQARNNKGATPLLRSAENGHEALLQLLLDQGADIEAKDWHGRASLRWVVEKNLRCFHTALAQKTALP